ncbi:hypothetical protein [Actinotalea subterranea]|uniref:hypothetical protein n=1 Tax=Actinotalea subterranea TaxID=2607497 RepID=UPI0011ED2793|nr:hypothetical protein [Actinotalea subterranea]
MTRVGGPWRIVVDGHDWVVREQPERAGAYDFEWLTGPDQYGFSMGSSDGSSMDEAAMRRSIADFLAAVDPATGYLE